MAQKSAGTLTLPWSGSGQRSVRRVAMDPTLLAVTLTLSLVGLVMVFSASAVVAGTRFHDPWYYLKRQMAWMAVEQDGPPQTACACGPPPGSVTVGA